MKRMMKKNSDFRFGFWRNLLLICGKKKIEGKNIGCSDFMHSPRFEIPRVDRSSTFLDIETIETR